MRLLVVTNRKNITNLLACAFLCLSIAMPLVEMIYAHSEGSEWVADIDKSESEKDKETKDKDVKDSKICPEELNAHALADLLRGLHDGVRALGDDHSFMPENPPELV